MYLKLSIALALVVVLAGSHWKAYSEGKQSVQQEVQAQTLKATEEARKREAELRTSVEKLDHELQTEKARSVAASRATAGRLREYENALRTARASARTAGGTDGPLAAIASECPGALAEMDQYARELAFRAVGLQRYATTVGYER